MTSERTEVSVKTMLIQLVPKGERTAIVGDQHTEPSEEQGNPDSSEDVLEILDWLCELMSPYLEFRMSGFGLEDWKVDVLFDLPLLLICLPGAAEGLKRKVAFTLGFEEQGTERKIVCTPQEGTIIAECFDLQDPTAELQMEMIPEDDFCYMLTDIRDVFLREALSIAPGLLRTPLFRRWVMTTRYLRVASKKRRGWY